jgi:hypothetical protein
MRYLLTGCRQHAERALLLLERAQAQEGIDASFQDLCRCMGERLLERKHAPVVRRFETARTDVEVHRLWRESIVRGEVASAPGAAVTHKAASAVTLQRPVTEAQRLDAARRLCRRPGAVSDGLHRPA